MIKKVFFITVAILFFMNSNLALAQLSKGDVTLTINPSIPKTGDKIKANLNSYSIDLNKSYIIWKLNDETRLTGIGKTSFSFILGDLNSFNEINVSIETVEGTTINKSIKIASNDVDLLWEATDSYAPPFYEGKVLFAKEGEVKVSAIPSISDGQNIVNYNNLSYVWEKDGNGEIKASGFGKNYFTYKNSFLDRSNTIRVNISTINNTSSARKEITITPSNPKIIFYKKNKNNWYTRSLDIDNYISKEGETIIAMPYYFSPFDIRDNNLNIEWFVNGERILDTITKNELFVKPAEGKNGQANLRVLINNIATLFQTADKRTILNF